ncbi:proteasome subunit beta [Candidatus Woesearchaeota archaeon]|nr:proteasome subunit beta [Candidatus Woesearchaeota archaeon]
MEKSKEKYMEKDVKKTGTTTLGMVCKDGIVMAADRRVTAGHMIANRKYQKIVIVADNVAITTAGLVSDAQLLTKLIKAEIKLKEVQTNRKITVKESVNILANMSYANIRQFTSIPGIVGFLVGGSDNDGFSLWEIGVDGSVMQNEEYVTDGSGSVFVHGVLETLYKKGLTINEGTELAVKALNASQKRDSASGSGFDVVTITKEGIKKVAEKEIETEFELK